MTAEDQLMCPLIRSGPRACEAITQDVGNRENTLRRYAIGALGSLRCRGALATLVSILKDEGERDYIRGDALEAIWLIDRSSSEAFANAYSGRSDYLGSASGRVLRGDVEPAMNLWDAILCRHD